MKMEQLVVLSFQILKMMDMSRGDVYPKGPFRMEHGIQRGSVLDMPMYPGDPLTPGYGATKDAKRLAIEDAPTIMKIPVMPISYADALPLLKALEGPVAPDDLERWFTCNISYRPRSCKSEFAS